jgi:hypothetical protein
MRRDRARDRTDDLLTLVESAAAQLEEAVRLLHEAVDRNQAESERVTRTVNGGVDDAGADDE